MNLNCLICNQSCFCGDREFWEAWSSFISVGYNSDSVMLYLYMGYFCNHTMSSNCCFYVCTFTGFILQTGILCFFGFWLSHLAHLFFALAFPFRAKKFMNEHGKTAHIIEVIIVIVLACAPGAAIIGTIQYQIDRFPPDVCIPSDPDVFFYTFSLAVSIGSTIGLAMLCATFAALRIVSAVYAYICNYVASSHTVKQVAITYTYSYIYKVSLICLVIITYVSIQNRIN